MINTASGSTQYVHRRSTLYKEDIVALLCTVVPLIYSVLTTSTEIILGTRKCGPCQERVFIYFKLQEAIEALIQLDLWKKDHSRIITE